MPGRFWSRLDVTMKHRIWILAAGVIAALSLVALLLSGGARAQDGDETADPEDGGAGVEYTWSGDVRAPDFPEGAEWVNASGPIRMEDLRGKIVMLDFWTYGCINCIHIIPDLKRLEAEYADELVVIGVHSAKFENEGETDNIRQIVQRYEVEHPVINDSDFTVWNAYGVRAWPTVMVIDPFGKVVGQLSGEPLYDRIAPVIETMAREYTASGAINPAPLPQWQPELASADASPLLFPGKVLADPAGGRLFISDSNHNRIVVAALDTFDVLEIVGSGAAGLRDGDFAQARFFRPQGLALAGDVLYVADTENHALRAVDLAARTVETVAGTGKQGFNYDQSGPGPEMDLNSPWDLVAHEGKLYIAMAGPHQLWVYDLESGVIGPYAGSGREALQDGKLRQAALNQPSGIDTDGTLLYVADAEASAIRTASLDPDGELKTIVGTGLFDFGDVDGTGDDVRLQHPLGVTVADDGALYVADTYNNKIKRIDPATRSSETFVGTGEPGAADGESAQFYEPGGLDYADGKLYVADTNNHAIRVVDLATRSVSTVSFPNVERLLSGEPVTEAAPAAPLAPAVSAPEGGIPSVLGSAEPDDGRVEIPAQTVGVGEGAIRVNITMPEGYKFNDLAPFTAIWADNPLVSIPPESRELRTKEPVMPLEFPAMFSEGQTELSVDLAIYWCEAVNETLCFVKRAELVVPLTIDAASQNRTVEIAYGLVPPVVNTDTFQ